MPTTPGGRRPQLPGLDKAKKKSKKRIPMNPPRGDLPPANVSEEILRPGKFTTQHLKEVCNLIRGGMNTLPAIHSTGISKTCFYRHVRLDPSDEIAHARALQVQAAQDHRDRSRKEDAVERAELELIRRGVDGWEEPVFDTRGNLAGYIRKFSDACLIFALKKLKPETFADGPRTILQNNIQVNGNDTREVLAAWRERLGSVDLETQKADAEALHKDA